jgi:tetratricopeptide (TPR) repeat protein
MIDSGSKFIRKYVLFLTLLCSVIPAFLKGQTPEQSYAFALYQSRQGNYDVAIKSLKRIQFFDEENNFPRVFEELADCYFQKADYENAYYYYDLATVQPGHDSLLPDIAARKVTCKLFDRQYQEALIDLLSFNGNPNARQQWEFDILYGITYFYLGEYSESKHYFGEAADSLQFQQITGLDADFSCLKQIEKRYNPKTAKVMSIIIPGSGQMWVGDYRDGINSILLVSGLLGASVALSGSLSLFDSFVIIAPWFQRYYMGGFQKAYEIATVKQQKEKNKVLAHIVKTLDKPVVK